jgi:saccharopine dehydrogenase-like NADP-dependent oxidoreductase
MKKICVLGLGYIGLPTASIFAANSFEVVGVATTTTIRLYLFLTAEKFTSKSPA